MFAHSTGKAPQERREAEALAMVEQLIGLGAATVLLRRGADGVLAADADSGEAYWVGGRANACG